MEKLNNEQILNILKEEYSSAVVGHHEFRDLLCVDVLGKDIVPFISLLRTDSRLDFSLFVDLSGVDYLEYNDSTHLERFAIIYILYSFANDRRVKLRAFVSESDPVIHTISHEYKGANWAEREVYDMFGIHFKGHPDLKRILMPDNYGSHPLRKDYPLKGLGERSQFPKYNIYNKLNRE